MEIELWQQARVHFADLIFQKCSETVNNFLTFPSGNRALATKMSKWKSSSRYRFVRSLPTSSSKSAPILPPDFEHFSVEIELLLQSRAHFVHLIVQKCSQPDSFSTFPRGSRAMSCAHFVDPVTASSESAPKPTVFYDFYMKLSFR